MKSDIHSLSIDDASLVRRYRQGDLSAMEVLVQRYQNRLYSTILRICGDQEEAAELTQETFVKIIEALNGFKGTSSFYTWAFRIAVNLAINQRHRRGRVGFRSLDEELDYEGTRARACLAQLLSSDSQANPADIAQGNELHGLVRKALMGLNEQHRTIIVLRDIEGMSYAQIAEVLGIELGTVRSRLSRAREALRQILETMI